MPAEAPAAPPPSSAPVIVEGPPPPPPPAPTTEIHLQPTGTIESGPNNQPKKGSAMERMQQELRKKAKPQFFEEAPPPDQPQTPPPVSDPKTPETGPAPEGEGETGTPATPSTPTDKKGEKNPWKLVDRYKAEAKQHQTRVAELEKAMPELAKLQELQTSLQQINSRNEELEKEIRFVNYQKSREYQDKYEKPYNAAWGRFAKEIAQIPATDRNGEQRPGSVEDIAEIANLPLGEAQALCEERFGSLASYVMNYRAKIMELHEQRVMALEEAKNSSVQRDQQFHQQQQQVTAELAKNIKETWSKANSELIEDKTHGPLFREVEGDQDGNQRLAKGFELVDRAFSENPNDPRLSPEERASVVRRHAAVRLRAAAFGRLNAQYLKLQKEHEALKQKLNGYQESTPGTGSPNGSASPATPMKGMDRIRADLLKIAK